MQLMIEGPCVFNFLLFVPYVVRGLFLRLDDYLDHRACRQTVIVTANAPPPPGPGSANAGTPCARLARAAWRGQGRDLPSDAGAGPHGALFFRDIARKLNVTRKFSDR
jgi:hypothetical protein